MDFNKASKIIAEEMFVGHNPTNFLLGIRHGDTLSAFVVDPAGSKAFAEDILRHVATYESETGLKVDSSGRQLGTVSPIQPS